MLNGREAKLLVGSDLLKSMGLDTNPQENIFDGKHGYTRAEISINSFAHELNIDNKLDLWVRERFAKKETCLPAGKFVLSKAFQNDAVIQAPNMIVFKDANSGFGLGFAPENIDRVVWLGALTFEPHNYSSSFLGLQPKDREPVVRQLQACQLEHDDDDVLQIKILEQVRWEKALLTLFIEWAAYKKINTIYVQGSSLNVWSSSVPMNRLKMRYDVTAERLGFEPYGDYHRLNLIYT